MNDTSKREIVNNRKEKRDGVPSLCADSIDPLVIFSSRCYKRLKSLEDIGERVEEIIPFFFF